MTKKNNLLYKLLCFALVFALLLSTVGCTIAPTGTTPTENLEGSTGTTAPTTQPTDPTTEPTTQPTTEPTAPTEPPVDPSVLVYELTQEDIDAFYVLLAECEELALIGEELERIDEMTNSLDEMYEYMEAQSTIAMILHYCDTKDSALETRYLECTEACADANRAYIEMIRRLYLSDTPAKDYLFADWTEQDIAQLLAYDGEVAEIQKRNTEIDVEYRASSSDSVRIPLYIEMVQNNNRIAQMFGYDNYYEYAYANVYGRDYTPEELQQVRQYAKVYLAETFDNALRNFNNSFYSLDEGQQKVVTDFLYTNYYRARKDYVSAYIDVLPESTSAAMKQMLEVDSTLTVSKNAEEVAFTTMIGDRSYCYFGPGYANSATIVHEGGHYYASLYTDLGAIPLDLAEVHSQGNEWLFVHCLKDHMLEKTYNALVDYRLYSNMAMIMICLMVDEFESIVYTTDISNYTAADFDALMESVATQYFDMYYINHNLTDINAYWREVVVQQPVYYISYGMSAFASFDLYLTAVEDFDTAMSAYVYLCENMEEEKGFLGNLTAAGLNGPFQEAFYQELAEFIQLRKK